VKHYFKLYLDDKAREDTGLLKNLPVEEVQKWYKDFLGGLREYLEGVWEKEWPKLWKSAKLDYIFSVPTVWLELPWIINRFKDAIKNSGFESSETCMRSWDIGLNEAAAAFCQFLRSRGGNSVSPGVS
jgi:hypothetical protein